MVNSALKWNMQLPGNVLSIFKDYQNKETKKTPTPYWLVNAYIVFLPGRETHMNIFLINLS